MKLNFKELFRLEKTSKSPSPAFNLAVPSLPVDMSLSTTSTRLLNVPSNGDSTTSLWSMLQCLTTLPVKKFSLIFNLNFLWCNLSPLSLALSLAVWEKRPNVLGFANDGEAWRLLQWPALCQSLTVSIKAWFMPGPAAWALAYSRAGHNWQLAPADSTLPRLWETAWMLWEDDSRPFPWYMTGPHTSWSWGVQLP